jgi:hypothetical protein
MKGSPSTASNPFCRQDASAFSSNAMILLFISIIKKMTSDDE